MIQKLQNSVLNEYSVAYAIQSQVANAINQCELITSAGYIALAENQRDIDFQIQNNLKRQGMAIIVMTPKLSYRGQDENGNVYFDAPELIVQCTEYVNINRASNKEKFATALDIATFLQTWLGSLSEPVITFGQLCPNEVEQGEDNGLLVCTSKFKTFAGQKKPDNEWFAERTKFGLKIDNLLPDVVDGVFSYPETPKSDFVVPGLSAIASYELNSRFLRNKNVRSVNLSDVVSIADYGAQNLIRNSAVEELDLTNLSSIGQYGLHYVASGATKLKSVKLGNLTNIGNYGMCNAFQNCSALTCDIDLSKVKTIGSGYALQNFLNGCKNFRGEIRLESLSMNTLPSQMAVGAFRNGCQISSLYIDLDEVPDTGNGIPFDNMCDNTTTNLRKLTIKNIRRAGDLAFRRFAFRTYGLQELEVTFSEKNKDSTAKSYNTAFDGFVSNDLLAARNMTRILLDYRNSNFAYTSTINTDGCGSPLNSMNTTNIIPEIYFPEEWYCHGSATSAYHGLIYPANFAGGQYAVKNTPNIVIQGIKKIDHQWQTILSPFAYMFAVEAVVGAANLVNFTVQDLEEVIMTNGLTGAEKQYFGLINHTFDNRTTIKNISFPKLRTLEGRIFHRANEFHANVRNLVVDLPKLETYIGDDYCIYSGPGYVDRINLHSLQLINNPIINITSNVGNNTQIYLNSDFLTINSNIISNTTNKPITFYFSENNRAYIESHALYATKFGGGTNCTIEFI